MSIIGSILKDMTPVDQARWWVEQAVADQFGSVAKDENGIYPFLPHELETLVSNIEDWMDAKIAAAIARIERPAA